ncbi:MAG: DUF4349 domain-containing protein [Solirubrobacteraceae bacterium]
MSRNELTAAEREELDALDRILAREPVSERHLELAALVDSVRAGAPRMDPAFAARLDAQVAERAARRRPRAVTPHLARPGLRRIALASGGLVAAAVAFTIVISSGVLNGSRHTPSVESGLSGAAVTVPRTPASAAPATSKRSVGPTIAAPTAGAGAGASNFAASPALHGAARLVHKDSTLTLATSPATMQSVANRIVAATERTGGVVQSSNVKIAGAASHASFTLAVPSGHLNRLIATLSALASVRALNQSTNDITNSYNQEQARLTDNAATRSALLAQLATAATAAQQTSLQKQLNRLEARIAAEHREIDRLANQGHTATLAVGVVAGASAAKHAASAGPFTTAFNRALHALEAILAIALVALAIVLPFALSALALWWGVTSVRQRARERAMRTA